ncbi:MAG: 1,2-dihydroxy-3-keto-5-methylthiopentene dioxygenase [Leucobacter sp.]
MTLLVSWAETDPKTEIFRSEKSEEIAAKLESLGVAFEQWDTNKDLADDADQEAVLEAYREEVDRITQREDYRTIDVLRLHDFGQPDFREKADAARNKFLDEHAHDDDEVRYFVDGSGTFYLHIDGNVHGLFCEKGDLVSVPHGTVHWFDTGEAAPSFCAIRFFHEGEGWVGEFTGSPISRQFPTHDQLAASREGQAA